MEIRIFGESVRIRIPCEMLIPQVDGDDPELKIVFIQSPKSGGEMQEDLGPEEVSVIGHGMIEGAGPCDRLRHRVSSEAHHIDPVELKP